MHPQQIPALQLPAIGTPCHGGKFAGITTGKDGAPYALVLLDDKPADDVGPNGDGDLDWQAAMDWAQKGLGADLPNRVEGALLFANLPGEFEQRWHWLNETTSWSKSSCWSQLFLYGYQNYDDKSYACRCRAVRRFDLQSFNPSGPSTATNGEAQPA